MSQNWAASRPRQSLARAAEVSGVGLHSGQTCLLRCLPAAPGTGISFLRTDLEGSKRIQASARKRTEHPRRTALREGSAEVHTVEHLLSAVYVLGIDDLLIEMDGQEMPGMDGSAQLFLDALEAAGIVEQDGQVEPLIVTEPLIVEAGAARVEVRPLESGLRVSYLLDYPNPILKGQHLELELSRGSYRQEIAPARTFCLRAEAEMLLKMGMGLGATTENTCVYEETGAVDTKLRYPDEAVRHKVLDLIGDLALLGRPLQAEVRAERSGHELNAALVTKLLDAYGL